MLIRQNIPVRNAGCDKENKMRMLALRELGNRFRSRRRPEVQHLKSLALEQDGQRFQFNIAEIILNRRTNSFPAI